MSVQICFYAKKYFRKLVYLTSIYKKGSKKEYTNYPGISVTATIGRMYGRIIRERLEKVINIGEEQSGFTAGRTCVDNIFALRQLIEERKNLVFIHLKKAYDTIPTNIS